MVAPARGRNRGTTGQEGDGAPGRHFRRGIAGTGPAAEELAVQVLLSGGDRLVQESALPAGGGGGGDEEVVQLAELLEQVADGLLVRYIHHRLSELARFRLDHFPRRFRPTAGDYHLGTCFRRRLHCSQSHSTGSTDHHDPTASKGGRSRFVRLSAVVREQGSFLRGQVRSTPPSMIRVCPVT
jgi:hypothetical protein